MPDETRPTEPGGGRERSPQERFLRGVSFGAMIALPVLALFLPRVAVLAMLAFVVVAVLSMLAANRSGRRVP